MHALVEEDPGLRFVLTGSSARKLRRGSWNLLAGRLVSASMHPFLAAELGADFSLERALRFGLVPLVWEAKDPEQTLRAHASLYLPGRPAAGLPVAGLQPAGEAPGGGP